MPRKYKTMTVQDLRDQLEGLDPEMEVHIGYDYNDYWNTKVAPKATTAEEQYIKYSDYHRMDKISNDDDNEDDKLVLVIS